MQILCRHLGRITFIHSLDQMVPLFEICKSISKDGNITVYLPGTSFLCQGKSLEFPDYKIKLWQKVTGDCERFS